MPQNNEIKSGDIFRRKQRFVSKELKEILFIVEKLPGERARVIYAYNKGKIWKRNHDEWRTTWITEEWEKNETQDIKAETAILPKACKWKGITTIIKRRKNENPH